MGETDGRIQILSRPVRSTADVQSALSDAGFEWLSHYGSVDPLHDTYGIKVCGIHDEEDALSIRSLLVSMFPTWTGGGVYHKDYGREPGFVSSVYRDKPRQREEWETA